VVKRVLSRSERDDAYRMLVHEAELNQAVRHPNVVEVFGAGQVDGETYLAMEYVEGVDLFRLLRRVENEQRPLPHELCAYIAGRVAAALSAVHAATDARNMPLDIVHRDVTPSNVYLSNDGAIKLGDFGIARVSQPRVRPSQPTVGLKGKFGYLAPEQIAGEPFDHRADLFALTVVLGEMLIGERIFPGSGQLAVLLAIRDGNFEPLRRRQSDIAPGLYEICMHGLARDPASRFQSASEMEQALQEFEQPSAEELRSVLSTWVRWAGDSTQLAQRIKGQIRDSVERMRAARKAHSLEPPVSASEWPASLPSAAGGSVPPSERVIARVRLHAQEAISEVAFPRLVEMIATGELKGEDEVAFLGEELRPIAEVETLARYLMPSTTATTARVFQVGVPDYQTQLRDNPLLVILARLRSNLETGALFVERRDESGTPKRKEIYVQEGRLLHVASSERDELLGEYLVRRGALQRAELDKALDIIAHMGGRLGDTLVSMGTVDGVDVFRAIRDLGRDRVAALCSWSRGTASFYRNTSPSHVEFPLDLDLASPMMAGVVLASTQGSPVDQLPELSKDVVPGPRAPAMASRKERGSVPIALLLLQQLATQSQTLEGCIRELMRVTMPKGTRSITEKEAVAALIVARLLGWISY
jgi:serine/threonine-protein kinase